MELTAKQRRALKAEAQRLKPGIKLGKKGLTPEVLAHLNEALTKHGLLKVRVEGDREEVRAYMASIPQETPCALVGQVGKTITFYRPKQSGETESAD